MDDVVSVSMAIFTVLSVLPAVEGIPLGLKWGDIFRKSLLFCPYDNKDNDPRAKMRFVHGSSPVVA